MSSPLSHIYPRTNEEEETTHSTMALQLATRSSKSLTLLVVVAAVIAVPLVLMCLLVAVAAASASAAASSGEYRPSYGDTYATCIPVAACDDTGCAIRCRDMGHNPAGSACWTSNVATIFCCCGRGRPPPVA